MCTKIIPFDQFYEYRQDYDGGLFRHLGIFFRHLSHSPLLRVPPPAPFFHRLQVQRARGCLHGVNCTRQVDTDIHTDHFGFQTWSLEIAACIQASTSACILQQNVVKFQKNFQFTIYQFTYRSPKLPQTFQQRPEKKKSRRHVECIIAGCCHACAIIIKMSSALGVCEPFESFCCCCKR